MTWQRGGFRLWPLAVAAAGVAALALAAIARPVQRPGDPCDGAAELDAAWPAWREARLIHALLARRGGAVARDVARQLGDRAAAWRVQRAIACRRPALDEAALQIECLDRQLGELRATVEAIEGAPGAALGAVLDAVQDLARADACANATQLARLQRLPDDPIERLRLRASSDELDRAISRWAVLRDPAVATTAREAARVSYAPLRARALILIAAIQRARRDPALVETVHAAKAAALAAGDPIRTAWIGADEISAAIALARPAVDLDWLLREHESEIAVIARTSPITALALRYDFLGARSRLAHARHQPDAAIGDAREQQRIGAALFGADSVRVMRARATLVDGLLATRRYDEALRELAPTIPILEGYGEAAELAAQLSDLATAQLMVGDSASALITAQRGYAIAPIALRAELLERIAGVRLATGDLAGAVRDLEALADQVDEPRLQLACARAALAAQGDARGLLAAATCLLDHDQPRLAVALLEPISDARDELHIRIRLARARGLRGWGRPGDAERARDEAAEAVLGCARLACSPALVREAARAAS